MERSKMSSSKPCDRAEKTLCVELIIPKAISRKFSSVKVADIRIGYSLTFMIFEHLKHLANEIIVRAHIWPFSIHVQLPEVQFQMNERKPDSAGFFSNFPSSSPNFIRQSDNDMFIQDWRATLYYSHRQFCQQMVLLLSSSIFTIFIFTNHQRNRRHLSVLFYKLHN